MADESLYQSNELQFDGDSLPVAQDAPELAICWERFSRAQEFRGQALEGLKNVREWAEIAQSILEHDPLDFEAYRVAATLCAETWNESLQLHAAFEALIGAQGSA
jgi:hypothetical protein